MSKKLNRTEIATLAKRILQEVDEVNVKYNEAKEVDSTYIAELKKIKDKYPLTEIKERFIKELKIDFGTNYEDNIDFGLSVKWNGNLKDKAESINEEIKTFNQSQFKLIYSTNKYSDKYNKKLEEIIDDITIAQIDITDVQMLINTIKSKLL